jgi:hypothetical protein
MRNATGNADHLALHRGGGAGRRHEQLPEFLVLLLPGVALHADGLLAVVQDAVGLRRHVQEPVEPPERLVGCSEMGAAETSSVELEAFTELAHGGLRAWRPLRAVIQEQLHDRRHSLEVHIGTGQEAAFERSAPCRVARVDFRSALEEELGVRQVLAIHGAVERRSGRAVYLDVGAEVEEHADAPAVAAGTLVQRGPSPRVPGLEVHSLVRVRDCMEWKGAALRHRYHTSLPFHSIY